MKFGARNQVTATVEELVEGGVMCQVKLGQVDASAGMSSVMTLESARDLDLKPGDRVRVVVKAIHVLLVKD